jgi:hypothetical protein
MKKTTILFLILLSLQSCSIVNKAFHKNKTVVDSTSTIHEKKDSVVNTDIVAVHKDSSKEESEIVIEFTGDSATITGKTNPDDYFYLNQKTGEIKASRVHKKVTIKGSIHAFNYDSLADHSKIQKTEEKSSDTKVTKKEKEVTKEVKKTKFWWWLLLLIPVYIIYRNWPKIKAVAVHLITGL